LRVAQEPRKPEVCAHSSVTPARLAGQDPLSEIKARWAMDTLSNAAKALAQIPHRRKSMLFVSAGLPASVEQINCS
jgi:hypothetical protein